MDKVFKLMKKKLSTHVEECVDSDFDQRFWAKFDQEFHLKKNESHKRMNWGGALLTFALLIVVGITVFYRLPENEMNRELAAQIIPIETALENMEVFAEWDTIDLSEEEWDLLLKDS